MCGGPRKEEVKRGGNLVSMSLRSVGDPRLYCAGRVEFRPPVQAPTAATTPWGVSFVDCPGQENDQIIHSASNAVRTLFDDASHARKYAERPMAVTSHSPRYNRVMKNLDDTATRLLKQVAGVIVPGFHNLDAGQSELFFSIIDEALADRPPGMRRQLALFLRVIDLAPLLRWGQRLGGLRPDRAEKLLRWFQESPVDRLRKGFWGLRTLIFMGYYGRLAVWSEIGYRPDFDGRGALDA